MGEREPIDQGVDHVAMPHPRNARTGDAVEGPCHRAVGHRRGVARRDDGWRHATRGLGATRVLVVDPRNGLARLVEEEPSLQPIAGDLRCIRGDPTVRPIGRGERGDDRARNGYV